MIQQPPIISFMETKWLPPALPGLSPALSFLNWSNVVDAILMMSHDGVRVDGITLISPRMALLLHSLPSNN